MDGKLWIDQIMFTHSTGVLEIDVITQFINNFKNIASVILTVSTLYDWQNLDGYS